MTLSKKYNGIKKSRIFARKYDQTYESMTLYGTYNQKVVEGLVGNVTGVGHGYGVTACHDQECGPVNDGYRGYDWLPNQFPVEVEVTETEGQEDAYL